MHLKNIILSQLHSIEIYKIALFVPTCSMKYINKTCILTVITEANFNKTIPPLKTLIYRINGYYSHQHYCIFQSKT